jgi:hypothetical protein
MGIWQSLFPSSPNTRFYRDQPLARAQSQLHTRLSNFQEFFPERNIRPCPPEFSVPIQDISVRGVMPRIFTDGAFEPLSMPARVLVGAQDAVVDSARTRANP